MSRDLVCREVVELLNGYLDQALPADEISAHVFTLLRCSSTAARTFARARCNSTL